MLKFLKNNTVDWKVFLPAYLIVMGCCVPLVVYEEEAMITLNHLYALMEKHIGWFYILSICIFVFLGFYMMLSRYGNIVLGEPDEKPMMNMFTYISTIICTTLGATIVRTGSGQWAKWINTPPLGIEPFSSEAIRHANAYGINFWGFQYMAICALVIPAVGYMVYVRKRSKLRLSEALRPLLGDKFSDGFLGHMIDIIFVVCMTAGNAVVLGLGTPLATATVAKILNVAPSFGLTLAITLVCVAVFGFFVFRGLEKGLDLLSRVNIYLAIAVLVFVLLLGPTAFIMTYLTDTIGVFVQNCIPYMFYTDPVTFGQDGIFSGPAAWAMFWWAYDSAAALIYGFFAVQISRGRTVREVLGVYFFTPMITCFVMHGVLGGNAVHQWLTGKLPLVDIYNELGEVHLLPESISALPMGQILMIATAILIVLFLTTTLGSVCFSMAAYTEKLDMSNSQPGRFTRITWAVAISVLALVLMKIGGLPPLEIAVVLTGAMMIVAEFMIFLSGMRMWKDDEAWIYNVRGAKGVHILKLEQEKKREINVENA